MRSTIIKVVQCAFAFHSAMAVGADLSAFENTCAELGFKKRTQAYGECVLELDQRAAGIAVQRGTTVNSNKGDGTPDDQTCQKYGFMPTSPGYSQCRMQIDQVREQAQNSQRIYNEQVAAQEREKERRQGEALMRFGLGLLAGPQRSPAQTYMQPIAPANGFHTFTLPNGRVVNCNTVGAMTNCN